MSDLFEKVTVKQKNKRTQKDKHKKGAKKDVHDLFVQGTNDSSIVSKKSVETLYSLPVDNCKTQYFNHFVKKAPRRTPVINRGYWIRMKSIRRAVEKIIDLQPENQRINIVNLGCGYDPLPFQLLDDQKINGKSLFCIDIDYPELANYKSEMIKMSPELLAITGNPMEKPSVTGVTFQTDNYALMGCDLNDQASYSSKMDALKANEQNTTNIFIAEVSLAYMTPEAANPIIETSSKFFNSHFVILEQLMPAGQNHPFAKRMINHFKKMEAPLQCVAKYPTIEKQIERFQSLGYQSARATDLLGCWELIDEEIKLKVAQVEPFDEWEEFFYFGQHYINLHATNQIDVQVYAPECLHPYPFLKSSDSKYSFDINKDVTIERKYLTCLNTGNCKFLTCGTNQSRLSSSVQLVSSDEEKRYDISTPKSFASRIASSSVTINGIAYLIGGRRIPGVGISDLWKLEANSSDSYEWKQLEELPSGRVKHASTPFGNGILIFGGLGKTDGFEYYSIETNKWQSLESNLPFTLESSSIIKNGDDLYLYGGLKHGTNHGSFEFNNTLYKIQVDLPDAKVDATPILQNESLARYGSQGASVSSEKLLIFGGVGSKLYDQNDTVIEVDLHNKIVSSVTIDTLNWQKSNPLIGFGIIQENDRIFMVGGGAVCYGFGSVWGSVMSLSIVSPSDSKFLYPL